MDNYYFMKKAIEIAQNSESELKIGGILVKESKIVVRGFREVVGGVGVHAEENVIKKVVNPEGGVLYLTLEPCFYRNNGLKSCCDLILESSVKKVVVGLKDLNPKISGKSIEKLKNAGVKVELCGEGLEKELLELLGERYLHKHNE